MKISCGCTLLVSHLKWGEEDEESVLALSISEESQACDCIQAADLAFCYDCFNKLSLQPSAPQNLTYSMWGRCWRLEFTNESQGDGVFPAKRLRKEACLDKLPDWLCLPVQGRVLHPNLVVSEDLTGAMEQKRWCVVSTNEKWQMHKSFIFCYVMGSAWHSLGLFGGSSPKSSHKFLILSLMSWNGPNTLYVCMCMYMYMEVLRRYTWSLSSLGILTI